MVPPVLKIRRDCSKINIVCSGHSLCVNDDPRAHQKLLHHSRKTDVQDISQDSPVRLKALPEFQLQESVPLKDHRDRNGKGHELPDHRRNGGAGNAAEYDELVSEDEVE